MKRILLIFFLPIFVGCSSVEISQVVNNVYELCKNKDFQEFIDWNIYNREDQKNTIVLDHIKDSIVDFRYLVIENDSTLCKQIFPETDSLFHKISNELNNSNKYSIVANLYFKYKAYSIDALSFRSADSLFILKKDGYNLIYTLKPFNESRYLNRLPNYNRIDSQWYYFKGIN
jgi:hypothetical protein